MTHRAAQPWEAGLFDGDENVIVDFKFSNSPKVTWWFDHHQSAFLTPADAENFREHPGPRMFYAPDYKSCTMLIANVSRPKPEAFAAPSGESILCAIRSAGRTLDFSLREARKTDARLYLLFVREQPFMTEQDVRRKWQEDPEASAIFAEAKQKAGDQQPLFAYAVSPSAADTIVDVAATLGASRVILGAPQRSSLINLLRGNVIREVSNSLPDDIDLLESRANSNYHSFQARFQQRLTQGLAALASYTWARSLDNASNFFSSTGDPNFPQNSYDVRAERGRSNFDVRHRLSASYSYDLPFGKGRAHLANAGWISTILSGWQSFGIVTFQSGRPCTVALAAPGKWTYVVGDLDRVLFVLDDAEMAGHGGDVGFGGGFLRLDLVAHRGDGGRIGTNENDTGGGERAGKGFALGQESIARMHRLGAALAAGLDDFLHHQIALGRSRRPDQHGIIRHFDVERVAVGLGIDGDGLDPHTAGSLDDPAGDLAAIGDQNSFEHVLLA